ncbi:unnamed protein product [Cylicocyclus nassatus]|uniref:N-acetyltransferase domain-containing protein n=1 Tax=Cylicocyclus nassatus TaxID=53992 RepID=A0AA36DUU7_CYLNA|nr:unnamed protein product [Cylicocyclus nassatus]
MSSMKQGPHLTFQPFRSKLEIIKISWRYNGVALQLHDYCRIKMLSSISEASSDVRLSNMVLFTSCSNEVVLMSFVTLDDVLFSYVYRKQPACSHVIYQDDPPKEVFLYLMHCAYQSELWTLAETDLALWKKAFGKRFRMLVAYDRDSLEPIGCICSATYLHRDRNAKTTVIGLYYVREEFRGKGIGNELFRRIIANKEHHNLYLNGISNMVRKYQILYNFALATPWRIVWYQIDTENLSVDELPRQNNKTIAVIDVAAANISHALEYDSRVQNDLDRTSYIRSFTTQPCADSKLAIFGGVVVGIGVARLLYNNELFIGPLYADNFEVARVLIYNLLGGKHHGRYRSVQIQFPSVNEEAYRLMKEISHGKISDDEFMQGLSTKFRIETDPMKIYSTTEYDISVF